MIDPHDIENGGHAPVDVDPFIPTGICAVCSPEPEPEPDTIPEEE
uniref:Minor tail protein n=2 Tax=unclassified bacterial viruses TaxID=12333 RepID=A0AAU7J8G2_9VIRU